MELRHLRYFVAVGEEQHFGHASSRLRVAEPALSRQIHDLEEEVGFKLFDRLPRGVKLSAAGRLFLEDARRILQEVTEAAARAGRVARPIRDATCRVHREFVLARCCSRFLSAISREARRRRITASAGCKF
jgi:DNA-binding transcriptional LysR family regulator